MIPLILVKFENNENEKNENFSTISLSATQPPEMQFLPSLPPRKSRFAF